MRTTHIEVIKEICDLIAEGISDDELPEIEQEEIRKFKEMVRSTHAHGRELSPYIKYFLNMLCAMCADEAEHDVSGVAAVYLADEELAEILLAHAKAEGLNCIGLIEQARSRITS